jgi:hypothetical protein
MDEDMAVPSACSYIPGSMGALASLLCADELSLVLFFRADRRRF